MKGIHYLLIFILVVVCVFFTKPYIIEGAAAKPVLVAQSPQSKCTGKHCRDNNSGPSCFTKNSVLQLKTGEKLPICEAIVGQEILSWSFSQSFHYSPIVCIPHNKNDTNAEFIQFKTNSGKTIRMTPDHLVFVTNPNMHLLLAKEIVIGDTFLTTSGEERVISLEKNTDSGIYTVVTLSDYIVVDEIVVSPFAINHIVPTIYYQLHKLIWNLFPNVSKSSTFSKINQTINMHLLNPIVDMFVLHFVKGQQI